MVGCHHPSMKKGDTRAPLVFIIRFVGVLLEVALLTDGRFSGGSHGYVVGLCHQAQEGGPIGLVQNDDIITIYISKKRMDVHLTNEKMSDERHGPRLQHQERPGGFKRMCNRWVLEASQDAEIIVLVLPVDYPVLNLARAESASTDGHFPIGLMSRNLTEKVAATVTSQCGCKVSVIAFSSRRNNIPSSGSAANWESNPNFPLMIEMTPTDMNATNFPPMPNASRPFRAAATTGECRRPMCQRRFHECYQDNVECSSGEHRFTNASDGKECNVYKKPDILQELRSITPSEFHESIPDASSVTNVPPN
ncbi:dihydroxy-acid dehydratase [Artemisia annua]|uniref:Dihydroxy-acid dehydratase n=1 Tax=Artemisia annua TaxID=35608 RepID=A0A2U1L4G1_ARTAN|nr:dihydroxy-acid dehydratase [Artemisia annua]